MPETSNGINNMLMVTLINNRELLRELLDFIKKILAGVKISPTLREKIQLVIEIDFLEKRFLALHYVVELDLNLILLLGGSVCRELTSLARN